MRNIKIKIFEEYTNDRFWEWFDNSKIVDNKDNPLVVYHGSESYFTVFDGDSYFTDDWYNADGYAGGENIYEVFLSIKNPLIVDAKGKKWDNIDSSYGTSTRDIVGRVNRNKYDGVVFNNIRDSWIDDEDYQEPSTVYVTFSSNQIKSSEHNNGNFSKNKPNINESYKHD